MTSSTSTNAHMIQAIFLDAANTLLYKPALIPTMLNVLKRHGIKLPEVEFASRHRWLSEVIVFPDRTSRDFYAEFNAQLLRSFGIIPNPDLLNEIFAACSYLPWHPFDDVSALQTYPHPLGVLSNWNKSLPEQLALIPNIHFRWILGSEQEKVRKPELAFFQRIIDEAKLAPTQIAYVGDSLRLDIEPALILGLSAFLIDRDNLYPYARVPRIRSLTELGHYL